MNKHKKNIVIYLTTFGLVTLICFFWILARAILPSDPFDGNNFIALPLMYSIYLNIKNWLSDWKDK